LPKNALLKTWENFVKRAVHPEDRKLCLREIMYEIQDIVKSASFGYVYFFKTEESKPDSEPV
jgi:hypothetical protein